MPNISHMIDSADTPRSNAAVFAVRGQHGVVRLQAPHHPRGDRLLTDVQVQEAADLRLAVEFGAALLEDPYTDHVGEQ